MFHKRLYTKGSEQLWKLGQSASQFLSGLKPQQATLTANRLVLQWSGSVTSDPLLAWPDRGESILYLFYWINSILPVPTLYTYQAASYKLLHRRCFPSPLLSKPRPLPCRFLCPGFPFTFGLNIGFQSTLRLMMEFQVIKTESKAHNPPALWFLPTWSTRDSALAPFFPSQKQRPFHKTQLNMEFFEKHRQENIKDWGSFLLEKQKPEALSISLFLTLNYIIGSLTPSKREKGTKPAELRALFHQGNKIYEGSSTTNNWKLMRKGKFPNHQNFSAVFLYGASVRTTKINKKEMPGRNCKVPSQKIQLAALGIKQYQRLKYQQKVDAINHKSEGS